MKGEKLRITASKRHKSEGGKPKGKRENGADRAKGEILHEGKINCDRENKGLYGSK